jgi:hypothetical protein
MQSACFAAVAVFARFLPAFRFLISVEKYHVVHHH